MSLYIWYLPLFHLKALADPPSPPTWCLFQRRIAVVRTYVPSILRVFFSSLSVLFVVCVLLFVVVACASRDRVTVTHCHRYGRRGGETDVDHESKGDQGRQTFERKGKVTNKTNKKITAAHTSHQLRPQVPCVQGIELFSSVVGFCVFRDN